MKSRSTIYLLCEFAIVALLPWHVSFLPSKNDLPAFWGIKTNSAIKADDPLARLDEAKRSFNDADFEKAIALLNPLLAAESLSKAALCETTDYLALAYLAQEQASKAMETFEQVFKKIETYKPGEQWWPHQQFMDCYYRISKKLSLPPPEKLDPGITTIAIIDFENYAVDDAARYQNLGKALAKMVITDFAVLSNLRVVERERLQYLIDELKLQRSTADGQPLFDKTSTAQLGKLLGAQSFVFGNFTRLGKIFRIDVRVVKTATGEIFKTQAVEGKPEKAFELAKNLTMKICADLEVAIQQIEQNKLNDLGKAEIPLEAVALYGDAMAQANREEYKEAYKKLEDALVLAPNFQKARDMLNVIRPFVIRTG